jgi:opacity protein-like surface antigen
LRSSVKETDTGFGAFFGYQFLPWLAAEVAYQDLGAASYEADTSFFLPFPVNSSLPINAQIKSEVTAASASALFIAPLFDHFSVGARLGVATTKAKFSISAVTVQTPQRLSDSTTNTNGVFGVNAQWTPTDHLGVRLEYQRYKEVGGDSDDDIDGFDVTLISLGVLWKY